VRAARRPDAEAIFDTISPSEKIDLPNGKTMPFFWAQASQR